VFVGEQLIDDDSCYAPAPAYECLIRIRPVGRTARCVDLCGSARDGGRHESLSGQDAANRRQQISDEPVLDDKPDVAKGQ
jgi:hypothetical protein